MGVILLEDSHGCLWNLAGARLTTYLNWGDFSGDYTDRAASGGENGVKTMLR